MSKTERELELEAKLQKEEEARASDAAELKKFKADLEAKNASEQESEKRIKALEEKLFAQERDAAAREIEAQANTLVSEKLISKGMKPFVIQLLGDEPEKKKYSFKNGDKDVEMSKFDLVKELAKQFSENAKVNLEERSEATEVEGQNQETEVDEVEKYAAEHKVSFSEAYKTLKRGKLAQSKGSIASHEDND